MAMLVITRWYIDFTINVGCPKCSSNMASCKIHEKNAGFELQKTFIFIYPLVMTNITMEKHHAINGKTHYFYGHFQ